MHRLIANLPLIPRWVYLRLHRTYMKCEAERAAEQRRAAELQTENLFLRRQLATANHWQDEYRALLEEMVRHTEEVACAR